VRTFKALRVDQSPPVDQPNADTVVPLQTLNSVPMEIGPALMPTSTPAVHDTLDVYVGVESKIWSLVDLLE
jgi:hypothetical protein